MTWETLFDLNGKPATTDWLVKAPNAQPGDCVWRYRLSGLDNVWVQGELRFVDDSDYVTFRYSDLVAIHRTIAGRIVAEPTISAARFRFLRKMMRMTLNDAASALALDAGKLAAWERGEGLSPEGAIKITALYRDFDNAQRVAA